MYLETSPDIANTIFEDRLNDILDSEAPMGVFQSRTKYLSWLTRDTKILMEDRDLAKVTARLSNSNGDWNGVI